jgi:hypothetical protein
MFGQMTEQFPYANIEELRSSVKQLNFKFGSLQHNSKTRLDELRKVGFNLNAIYELAPHSLNLSQLGDVYNMRTATYRLSSIHRSILVNTKEHQQCMDNLELVFQQEISDQLHAFRREKWESKLKDAVVNYHFNLEKFNTFEADYQAQWDICYKMGYGYPLN